MLKKLLVISSLLFLSSSFLGFASDTYTVSKVIDGDTIILSNGEHVRLVGIDTPESRINAKLQRDSKRTGEDAKTIIEMGKKAAEFTRKLVEGKEVRLEFDVQQRDKYRRLLAYVYVQTNIPKTAWLERDRNDFRYLIDGEGYKEIFLNATIVNAGYAQVMTIPPNVKYADLFLKLQKEAREQKRGLWG